MCQLTVLIYAVFRLKIYVQPSCAEEPSDGGSVLVSSVHLFMPDNTMHPMDSFKQLARLAGYSVNGPVRRDVPQKLRIKVVPVSSAWKVGFGNDPENVVGLYQLGV
jgi:hypothetical protein